MLPARSPLHRRNRLSVSMAGQCEQLAMPKIAGLRSVNVDSGKQLRCH